MQAYGLDLGRDDDLTCEDPEYFDISPWAHLEYESGSTIAFERVGINSEHVERFDLPENPNPKSTDKDSQVLEAFLRYVSGGDDVNIELNALKEFQREYLEELIEDSIREHIDLEAKREAEQRLEEKRDSMKGTVKTLQATLADE